MKLVNTSDTKLSVQVAPLIDVVFLLLIYFMVTATIIKKEGDLSFVLPVFPEATVFTEPVEARICINADGMVVLDGLQFDQADRKLEGLVQQIRGLKKMAALQHSLFYVTLDPDQEALHSRVVDVLDACAESNVGNLTYAQHDA